jgi:hypothetical protein
MGKVARVFIQGYEHLRNSKYQDICYYIIFTSNLIRNLIRIVGILNF